MAKSEKPVVKGVTLDDILLEKRTIPVKLPFGVVLDLTYNPSKYTEKVAALLSSPKGTDKDWLCLMDIVLDTQPAPTPLTRDVLDKMNVPTFRLIAQAVYQDYFPPAQSEPEAASEAPADEGAAGES